MNLIELQNVSLRYREGFTLFGGSSKLANNNLSLTIRQGENVGVVGGNGAGKSTLLKILAGIYTPDEGKVITHRRIRTVFIGLQSGFIPYLSGIQNINLTGLLLGMSRREVEQKLDAIIEYSELGKDINRPVFTYSAGMKARLAFSVSVFSDPDLLLLDEVMGVGDKEFRQKSSKTLKEMISGDAAVVIVSHDMNYLGQVCDHAVLLSKGGVIRSGVAAEILQQYEVG